MLDGDSLEAAAEFGRFATLLDVAFHLQRVLGRGGETTRRVGGDDGENSRRSAAQKAPRNETRASRERHDFTLAQQSRSAVSNYNSVGVETVRRLSLDAH